MLALADIISLTGIFFERCKISSWLRYSEYSPSWFFHVRTGHGTKILLKKKEEEEEDVSIHPLNVIVHNFPLLVPLF